MKVTSPLQVRVLEHPVEHLGSYAERWIKDGHEMARRESTSVFTSIDAKHGAEKVTCDAIGQQLKSQGKVSFERRRELDQSLERARLDAAQHLKELAQGRVDLVWANALSVLNAALVVFVFLAFGPSWLAILLALTVLASTVSVEQFFQAYDDQAVFREAFFLTVAILSLLAQFWIGTLRGMFLTAVTPEIAGPITETLHRAAPVLRYSLGLLALVTECLAGFTWYRVRRQLWSATARAVRERDRLNAELVTIYGAIQRVEREPDLRRAYRQIGARQFLSSLPEPKPTTGPHHLAAAFRWALIALAAILFLILMTNVAFGEPVRTTVVLIDLTKSTPSDGFKENIRSIGELINRLPAGERFVVIGITNDFGNPKFLLDHVLPASSYLDLALRAERERLSAQWQRIASGVSPDSPKTDVLGALTLVTHIGDISPNNTRLVIYSDLRQSSHLNLEAVDRIDVRRVLASLKDRKNIPRLTGAQVFLLGVDPTGKSAAYFESLKEFWLQLFTEAGAEVRMFSVGRHLPYQE